MVTATHPSVDLDEVLAKHQENLRPPTLEEQIAECEAKMAQATKAVQESGGAPMVFAREANVFIKAQDTLDRLEERQMVESQKAAHEDCIRELQERLDASGMSLDFIPKDKGAVRVFFTQPCEQYPEGNIGLSYLVRKE